MLINLLGLKGLKMFRKNIFETLINPWIYFLLTCNDIFLFSQRELLRSTLFLFILCHCDTKCVELLYEDIYFKTCYIGSIMS